MKITGVQLAKRVERWQKTLSPLGVAHYKIDGITITDEMPMPRTQASVRPSLHYDHVYFWFRDDYLADCTEEDLDQTIVHEWLHVVFRDFDHALSPVEKWMPDATYEDWEERVDHEREGVIDRLADLIVDLNR